MRTFALAAALLLAGSACSVSTDPDDLRPGLDATVPPAPQALSAAPGATWVALRWDAVRVADVDGYVVLAGAVPGDLAPVGETADPAFVVTGLAEGTRRWFAVMAIDEAGNVSEPSAEAEAVTAATVPGVTFDPDGSASASVRTRLVLAFDAAMETASVPPAVSVSAAGPVPACAWSWDPGDRVAVCRFAADLEPATAYTVSVGAGARDRAGNPLAPASVTFATEASPDGSAPTVSGTTPGDGEAGVAPETAISITFSEPMSEAATQGAFRLETVAGADAAPWRGGAFAWTNGGRTLTYRPRTSFPGGALVAWSIGSGAADLAPAPNALAAPRAGAFRVAYRETVRIESDAGLDGSAVEGGSPATALGTLLVGDRADGAPLRSWVSFPHAALVPPPARIVSATLSLHQAGCAGAPYEDLDAPRWSFGRCSDGAAQDCDRDLLARHVDAGAALGADDFAAPFLAGGIELAESPAEGWVSGTVTSHVASDVAEARGRTQFRLEFPVATDGDAVADVCWFEAADAPSSRPVLEVTFDHP